MQQVLKIKFSRLSDFTKICKLYKQLSDFPMPLENEYIWFKNKIFIKQKIKKQEIIIAANKKQQIVGHLSFRNNPWSIEIDTLIVDKKHRRKGVGTKLIEFFINKVRNDKKYSRIKAGSYKCFDCKNFYLKTGFKLRPDYESEDTWEFIREL